MKYNKFKLYLAFCIFIFLTLSFVVLFYSFGYKYNPKKGKIVRTGAMVLKTFPKNANIYIDGSLVKKNSGLTNFFSEDTKIEALEPRQFNIVADLDGFSRWEKNINIEGEHVMEFKNIVLIKKEPKKDILSQKIEAQEDKNFWISNNKNKIAFIKTYKEKAGLFTYDIPGKTEKFLFSFEEIFPIKSSSGIAIKNVIWSENDSKIFLSITKDKKVLSAIIALDGDGKIYRFSDSMENAKSKWNFQFNDSLFYLKNNILFKNIFLNEKISATKVLEGVSGFLIEGNTAYYIKAGSPYLFRSDMDRKDSETKLFQLPDDLETKEASSIIRSQNSYMILTEQNRLYLADEGSGVVNISSNATNASFFNNSSRIIYYNDNEIWIYYIKEKSYQPQKPRNTNELLTRYSGNIGNIYLYGDDEHILYKEGYVFKFAEFDDRGKRNVFDVVSVKTNDVEYLASNNSIIYLENGNIIRSFLDDENR